MGTSGSVTVPAFGSNNPIVSIPVSIIGDRIEEAVTKPSTWW